MSDRTLRRAIVVGLAGLLAAGAAPPETRPARDYAPYPAPDIGYVTDLADLLSDQEEQELEAWLYRTEEKTGVEIAVVTIESIRDYPGTANRTIEAFATGLFDTYGIGNLPRNDGVLLLVARRDRRARIELGAHYGFTRDADARRIMDRAIVPRFKQGDYAGGIRQGVKALMREFAGVRVGVNWTLIILGALIVVGGLVSYSLFRSGKRGWGWVVAGLVIVLLLLALRILGAVLRSRGGSGGGSVGGFGGGFGGGFSGGGGATGSW